MNEMPIALLVAHRVTRELADSARPDAPVVPHVDKVSVVQRIRTTVAAVLLTLADVVSPARPIKRTPARAGVRGEVC